MLSADAVSGVSVSQSADSGTAGQITSYAEQSSELAESYALEVEAQYVDSSQEFLESTMADFFAESGEDASSYDPYAGLSESTASVFLDGYDSELSTVESSSLSVSATETGNAETSYSDSYTSAVSSNDGSSDLTASDGGSGSASMESDSSAATGTENTTVANNSSASTTPSDGTSSDNASIFDYDNQISSYADDLVSSALGGEEESALESVEGTSQGGPDSSYGSTHDESSGSTVPDGDNAGESGGGTAPGSETSTAASTGDDSSEGSSGASGSSTGDSSSTDSGSSGNADSSDSPSTSTGGTGNPPAPVIHPFVTPEELQLNNVQLPAEVKAGELLTLQPLSATSFSTSYTESVAPTTVPFTDPELGDGHKSSSASATVTSTQVWNSPTDWSITHSLVSAFSVHTNTTHPSGVNHGSSHSGNSGVTITVTSHGVSTVTFSASDLRTNSQSGGWNNSDPTLGTVDQGGYTATSTLSSSVNFTMTESLTTLQDGSPGRTSDLQFSMTKGAAVDFSANYELYESTGVITLYFRNPVTLEVVRVVGGNGETLDASGSFDLSGSADVTTWLDASATYADGVDAEDSDITGTAGFTTSTTSEGSVSQSIDYDSQLSSGTPGTDSEVYDYISLSFSDSAGGATISQVDAEFPLNDPAPVPTNTTTTTSTPPLALSAPPDDGVGFEVTHNDNGSTTFSLLVDSRSPTQYSPMIDGKYYTVVSIDSSMTIAANAGMEVTEDAFGVPVVEITTSGSISGSSMTSVAEYDQHNPGNVAPDGFYILHQATLWITTETETWTVESDWNFTVGISLLGTPTVSGSWSGQLTWDADYLSENNGTTTYSDVNGVVSAPETYYAFEQALWSSGVNGSVSSAGGTLSFSGVTEEWTSGGTGTAPATLIAPPDPWSESLDNVQFALDIAGMVPVVGEAADLINVGIHVGRGNWTEAAVSGAAAIPFMGMIATGGKFLKKAAGKVDDVGEALISKSDDLARRCDDFSSNCFIAGTQVVVALTPDDVSVDVTIPQDPLVEPASNDNQSASATIIGVGVVLAFARHNRGTPRHRRRWRLARYFPAE